MAANPRSSLRDWQPPPAYNVAATLLALAAAVGVSLRHLQALFREQDRNIADWIWRRRLEIAAQRLADPGFAHLAVGELAYSCGFCTQSHFSRRFKDSYGISPSEYRWRNRSAPELVG